MKIPSDLLQWLALAATIVSTGGEHSSNDVVQTLEAYDEGSSLGDYADEGEELDMDQMVRTFDLNKLIYPGTKYCGQGNIADAVIPPEQYLAAEDACCKAHDECPQYIDPGQTDPTSGLTNECYLSQMHCDCEDKFFKCLKSVGSKDANVIGTIYYSGLTRKCFKKAVPVKCKAQVFFWSIIRPTTCRTCLNYCTDTSAAEEWHWRPTSLFQNSDTVLTTPPPC